MGFRKDITRSQLYLELDNDFLNNQYFGYKREKFLHNIDTFYYTVSLENDFNKNPDINDLIYELSEKKKQFLETKELVHFMDKLYIKSGRFNDIYEYRITVPDKYDIFVATYLPNDKTPRFVVQLRSPALWIDGVRETVEDSFYQLTKVIGEFGLKIANVYENRLDYCYHTNCIQNMYKFFNDKIINTELKTNMKRWRKQGLIFDDGLTLDYFALGELESNNVFVRIYNKTREVIEMQYKGFFIEIWFREGLISYYDKYCLEYAYKYGNYEKVYEGMLKFYLEFGKDELHKKEIEHYLKDTDINFNEIKELAKSLCPQITTVCNIEFQTKRKFYYYADKYIDDFEQLMRASDKFSRLYKIIDNRKVFLDYITNYNIRFVNKDGEYKDWWNRLRNLKIDGIQKPRPYARDYQKNLDIEKIKMRSIRSVATHALYNNKVDSNFMEDVSDFLCSLNDNDISINDSCKLVDYKNYKEKRYPSIKNRVSYED